MHLPFIPVSKKRSRLDNESRDIIFPPLLHSDILIFYAPLHLTVSTSSSAFKLLVRARFKKPYENPQRLHSQEYSSITSFKKNYI